MAKSNVARIDTAKPAARPVAKPLWTLYQVRWEFLTRLYGSTPADPAIVQAWIDARQPRVRPPGGKSIEEINEEVLASLDRGEGEPEEPSVGVLVFQRYNGGLVMRSATVKSHLKDCSARLAEYYISRIEKEKSFAVRCKNGLYVDERQYWLPILRPDGQPVTAADGKVEKPVHFQTRQGPRDAIKVIEYVEPPSHMVFTLKVLGQSVKEDDLHHLFQYGGTHGYAGERSDGEGRYSYSIERVGAQG